MTTQPPGEDPQYQAKGAEQYRAQPMPPQVYGQPQPIPPQAYGQPQPLQVVQGRSAGVAVIASLFIPGLGSMLNERVGKGVLILIGYLVSITLCLVFIGLVLAPAVWIYGMVTANSDAHAWNRKHGILS
jgi:TM2 domain-containing membrane protein YozV